MIRTLLYLAIEAGRNIVYIKRVLEDGAIIEEEYPIQFLISDIRQKDTLHYCYTIDERHPKNRQVAPPQTMAEEYAMSYDDYACYLYHKYGPPIENYFTSPYSYLKNNKIERLKEGLFLHHMAEECQIQEKKLLDTNYAKEQPRNFYQNHNFVYCNFFEHMLLHFKIARTDYETTANSIGADMVGAMQTIRELNAFYGNGKIHNLKRTAAEKIKDRYEEYIALVFAFYQELCLLAPNKQYKLEMMAQDANGVIVDKIYNDLHSLI